jgi:acyl-CoA synthetase (NDP forming)
MIIKAAMAEAKMRTTCINRQRASLMLVMPVTRVVEVVTWTAVVVVSWMVVVVGLGLFEVEVLMTVVVELPPLTFTERIWHQLEPVGRQEQLQQYMIQ